jgi:hypothetical protein
MADQDQSNRGSGEQQDRQRRQEQLWQSGGSQSSPDRNEYQRGSQSSGRDQGEYGSQGTSNWQGGSGSQGGYGSPGYGTQTSGGTQSGQQSGSYSGGGIGSEHGGYGREASQGGSYGGSYGSQGGGYDSQGGYGGSQDYGFQAMRHPAHKVDRASKGMASKAVTAAKAHRLGTDRRETSRQGKADTDRKVGTAPKIGMGPKVAMALKVALALKPVRVRRAGKLAAGARRAATHHRRANSPEVTADAVANNQDMAGTAAKAAAMDPRRATAHTGATVLKGAKRRAVAGAGTRAVGVRLD